jgi:ABC-type transporter Mla subunit MlaD
MTTDNPAADQQFKLLGPTGDIIAHGSLSAVTEPILTSAARAEAADLVKAAEDAVGQLAQLDERQQMARIDDIRRFCDGASRLVQRLDAFEARARDRAIRAAEDEQRHIQAMLDAMPDPDDPSEIIPKPEDPEAAVLDEQGVEMLQFR